jgi:hypothetical protein
MPFALLDGPRITLALARRKRRLEVRLRWLRHEDHVLRLYVIHAADR